VVPRLIRDGRITRPALGVSAASEQVHRALRLPEGVALVQVNPNGPAGRAGLQPFTRARDGSIVAGDVITAINDEAVGSLDDMLTALERRQPGEGVTLTVWRAGKTRKVQAALAAGE
jgi:S1-C subfamily serine protease